MIFCGLSLFPILLLSASWFDGVMRNVMVYVAFGYFGFIMSGVMILWQLSSIRFSRGDDAGVYHSVHVAATGIRGALVPLFGYFTMSVFGKSTALVASSIIFLIAGLSVVVMRRIDFKRGEGVSLRTS